LGERFVGIKVLGGSRLFESPDAPTMELEDLLPKVYLHNIQQHRNTVAFRR
jgi:hypothetical protein